MIRIVTYNTYNYHYITNNDNSNNSVHVSPKSAVPNLSALWTGSGGSGKGWFHTCSCHLCKWSFLLSPTPCPPRLPIRHKPVATHGLGVRDSCPKGLCLIPSQTFFYHSVQYCSEWKEVFKVLDQDLFYYLLPHSSSSRYQSLNLSPFSCQIYALPVWSLPESLLRFSKRSYYV